MTRREFIQRAVISMAGKVIGTNGITDDCDWHNVVMEAIALADEIKKQGCDSRW